MTKHASRRGPSRSLCAALVSLSCAGALTAGSLLVQEREAIADEPGTKGSLPVLVIAVQTDDADDQAQGFTQALRSVIRSAPGWVVTEGDYALAVLTGNLKCPDKPDAACESRIADQVKADRYLWGTLDKKGNEVVGELHFWVRGRGSSKAAVKFPANLTDPKSDALMTVARTAFEQVSGGAPKGNVKISAGQVDGQIFIDDAPFGALKGGEATIAIPLGAHRITVKAPGYKDATAQVTSELGVTNEVSLELAIAPKETVESGATWKKPAAYVSFGVAAVGFGIGIAGGVKYLSTQSKIKSEGQLLEFGANDAQPKAPAGVGTDSSYHGKVCDFAGDSSKDATLNARFIQVTGGSPDTHLKDLKSACSGSTVGQQVIGYVIGGVAAAAGIYFLVTAPSSKPATTTTGRVLRTLRVDPTVGRTYQGVDLSMRF